MDPLTAVGYVRVSSATQVEDGFGLEIQERQLAEWAERGGHQLLAVHRDEGISGTKEAVDRPGLGGALVDVEDGAGALVVAKLDRLARQLTVQEAVLAQVWKSGGRVFSVDVGEVLQDDPDDPMKTAFRQMMGVFSQLERGMIAARLRAGKKAKAARGGYAYGAPRLGMRAEDRELVVDAGEQATIARMVELRGQGLSLRQIAATLEAEGRPTKRGGRWQPKVISSVLLRVPVATVARGDVTT